MLWYNVDVTSAESSVLVLVADSWSIIAPFSLGYIASCGVMKTPPCIIQLYKGVLIFVGVLKLHRDKKS